MLGLCSKPGCCNYRALMQPLLKPTRPEPVLCKRCPCNEKHAHHDEQCLHSLQLEKSLHSQGRLSAAKKKKKKTHPKHCVVMSGPRNWYGRCQDSGSSITTRIPLLTLLCQPLPCFSSVAALPAPGPNPWKLLTSISLILLQESYITEGIHFETGFLSCPV